MVVPPDGISKMPIGMQRRSTFQIWLSNSGRASRSRDEIRPSVASIALEKIERAQGMPGVSLHPQPRVQLRKHTS
jgi:hypothetical protein